MQFNGGVKNKKPRMKKTRKVYVLISQSLELTLASIIARNPSNINANKIFEIKSLSM